MKTQSYLSDFELVAMLVLLRLGDNAYGVPIAREIEEQTQREVKLGSVYAALERPIAEIRSSAPRHPVCILNGYR
jgi:PadR family transcriptional regulator PadR